MSDMAVIPTRLERWRYLTFGRVVPGAVYALFGFLQVGHFIDALQQARGGGLIVYIGGPLASGFYTLFCVIPVVIYLARPIPRARNGTVGARLAAFGGTTMLLVVGVVTWGPRLPTPLTGIRDAAAIVLAAFTGLEVYGLLYLRLSFSIIPEARRLVTGGPYAVVRHPLYFAEIVVAFAGAMTAGSALAGPYFLSIAALVPFVAIQYLRSRYEERLLRATFPEYEGYAERTARLIPFIW